MQQHPSASRQEAHFSQLDTEIFELSQPAAPARSKLQGQKRIRVQQKLRDSGLALLFLAPAFALFIIFSYYPFFRAIWLSLNITNELGNPVRFIGLDYYIRILNLRGDGDGEYLRSLLTSCQFALIVVTLQLLIGIGLAALAQAKLKGIGIFRTIFTFSIAISLASSSVIWSLIYDPTTNVTTWLANLLRLPQPGLLNNAATALLAIAVMTVWSGLGFNFVISLAGMQAIPEELYESAALDGAGPWQAFRHITLPLLTPILLFLLVINTIQSFQAFTQFSVLMNGEGPDSATNVFVYATYHAFWFDHRYGFASAMSIILFLILLLLSSLQFIFLGRRVHYR
ncbi:sugar ABC transporter permease [Ktedonosporobacter rubrisoli]|uniref:Sugar ABC transporter permease n=1 Tax=Ktedonosporobacter rubrisoli TaxID=2509675 RepID=A0A4P6JTK1_KTERU|nr:sugar ABC transporter permease [Ktedonosporobacter rubrisoli]QBD78643.1 sugar ABC transporter permease [Ktedonosporobacter rubrisoli]